MLIKNSGIAKTERKLIRTSPSYAAADALGEGVSPSMQAKEPEQKEVDLHDVFKVELAELKAQVKQEALNEAQADIEARVKAEVESKQSQLEAEFAKAKESLDGISALLNTTVEELRDAKTTAVIELEAQIVHLSLECVYKLTGERTFFKSVVERSVKESIAAAEANTTIKIRYSEQDVDIAEGIKGSLPDHCTMVLDNGLASGACLVEAGYSTTDMGVFTQLDQLRDALIETYQDRRSHDL